LPLAAPRIDALAAEPNTRVTEVVARHERTLLRVARQASLCHDDALDAYQRALEIFVRRVDTVERATEVAWLKVVVRHEAMAIRRARMESVTGDELDLDAFVPGPDRTVDEQIASGERVRRSAEALRALKPDEAKALMMKAHGLSYEEIGARNGWSYTKVNRAVTEGRRRFLQTYEGIESGAECERYGPIVEALSTGSATTAQVLQIRPHLRHCTACRATVRELHVSRLRRASLFWPVFLVAEPFGRVPNLKHEAAALFHRAQASDLATGTGLASAGGGGGRIATVGAVLGLCLGGASVGTVCVVTGGVPDLVPSKPARVHEKHDAPRRKPPERTAPRAEREAPVVTKAAFQATPQATPMPTPRPRAKPKATSARTRRKAPAREAAPREFSFENQAPAGSTAEPSATTATSTQASPPPTASKPSSSKTFSPAEQEFAP
jgi:RNA polymerase sigma factor (sigma-70 family)